MKIDGLEKYSDAEKIVLAEQLWDSVAKHEITLDDAVEKELDKRLERLEKGAAAIYTWEEVKEHLKRIRQCDE